MFNKPTITKEKVADTIRKPQKKEEPAPAVKAETPLEKLTREAKTLHKKGLSFGQIAKEMKLPVREVGRMLNLKGGNYNGT